MRSGLLLAVALWAASSALADRLPEQIDFRIHPAFLRFTASPALRQRIEERTVRECLDKAAWDAESAANSALTREQQEIEQPVYESMEGIPFDDAYRGEVQKRLAAIPRHVELAAGQRERVAKSNAIWARLEPCIAEIERTTYEEVDFYADPELTRRVGQMRVFVEMWQVRTLPGETWEPYQGDFIPAGESSYFFQTVLEKRGDLLLLPKRPFPVPVWFDYRKFSGNPVGPETPEAFGGLFEIFSAASLHYLASGELVVPVSVDRGRAVFKIVPEEPDDSDLEKTARDALESGKTKSVPVESLFDADGHLTVRFYSPC